AHRLHSRHHEKLMKRIGSDLLRKGGIAARLAHGTQRDSLHQSVMVLRPVKMAGHQPKGAPPRQSRRSFREQPGGRGSEVAHAAAEAWAYFCQVERHLRLPRVAVQGVEL